MSIRLIELSEQIEVLETLLQIKNDSATQLKSSLPTEGEELKSIFTKISLLPFEETKLLLSAYVKKVVSLKLEVKKGNLRETELREQVLRQEEIVQGLEQSLDQSQIDKDLRLTRLHKVVYLSCVSDKHKRVFWVGILSRKFRFYFIIHIV